MQNIFLSLLLGFSLVTVLSQNVSAEENFFRLELNNLQPTETGCRVSFVAENKLSAQLEKSAVELVVFDTQQLIAQMLVLDLGKFSQGKTRVIQFDLSAKCPTISRLLVNGFVECSGPGINPETCLSSLKSSSRAAVKFGS